MSQGFSVRLEANIFPGPIFLKASPQSTGYREGAARGDVIPTSHHRKNDRLHRSKLALLSQPKKVSKFHCLKGRIQQDNEISNSFDLCSRLNSPGFSSDLQAS